MEETAALFPAVRESYQWVKRAARILKNEEGLPAKKVRRRLVQLLAQMRRAVATTDEPAVRAGLKQFVKVTRSYWPGLFACYERRICRGRITTWSTPSAVIATTRPGQRSASGVAGPGGDGLGAGDLGAGDAAAAGRRLGVEPGLC